MPVTVLYRGKPRAKLVPIKQARKRGKLTDHPACGMWKDREDMKDVVAYVRKIREPRFKFKLNLDDLRH